jgi:murein endopeptidase
MRQVAAIPLNAAVVFFLLMSGPESTDHGLFAKSKKASKQKKLFKNSYTVQERDTLSKIAAKLHTTVESLKKANKLKEDRIFAGQVIFYYSKEDLSSKSIGLPNEGSLINASKLPETGKGYIAKNKNNLFGTAETVAFIKKCASEYRKEFPGSPPLVIGDLSKKDGKALPPHVSHQSGRDFDVGFPLKGKKKHEEFLQATPENIDLQRTWFIMKCFISTKEVKYIFMENSLQKALFNYLMKRKASETWLSRFRELPGKSKGIKPVFQTDDEHRSHFHVRFKCPGDDKDCLE